MSDPVNARIRPGPVISAPTRDGALLAVAVEDGVAEISRAAVLMGTARRIVEAIGIEASEDDVAGWLSRNGAETAEQARRDARQFLAELQAHGLVARGSAAAHTRRSSPGATADPPTRRARRPRDWAVLARAVLARGHRLRFRALGRSMRPLVPHGSLLEVEPRPFERVRLGEIVLYATAREGVVAHRVIGTRAGALLARGDSGAGLDTVKPDDFLGVVTSREQGGRWKNLSTGPARWRGLVGGFAYRFSIAVARTVVVHPLRGSYGGRSLTRAGLRAILKAASTCLLGLERLAARARGPLDVVRAALYSTAEKDADSRALYASEAIQRVIASEENLRAGLTLLEEVVLARHATPPGKALVLGCGTGRECLALTRRGFEVTGLDREEGMLARARELAEHAGLSIRYVRGGAVDFEVGGGPYDFVVVLSGLYNMILPRDRRVLMLATCARHLRPGGRVLLTFLSAYASPGEGPRSRSTHLLGALNPEHEQGDLYLLNEAVHIFPSGDDVVEEAAAAGLETEDLVRDQRTCDRRSGQVRGFAILRRSDGVDRESARPGG